MTIDEHNFKASSRPALVRQHLVERGSLPPVPPLPGGGPLEPRPKADGGKRGATGLPAPLPTRPGTLAGRSVLRVLIVHDDTLESQALASLLGRCNGFLCRSEVASDAEAATRALAGTPFHVCLLFARQDHGPALELLARIEAGSAPVAVIVVAECPDADLERDALDGGASDILDWAALEPRGLERSLRLSLHRKRAAVRLDRLAQLDGLTGLGNRVLFQERLERALVTARRQGTLAGVMMLDLNGFKAVNDALGHAAGDELLRALGERLKGRLRATDTIARVGGDEFAVLIENLQQPEQAETVARKLLNAVEPAFLLEGRPVSVSGSLGLAVFPHDGDTGARLLKLADAAMYAAKSQGGNTCIVHSRLAERGFHASPGRAAELREALELGALELAFEPQMPLSSDRIGVSTVPRWHHPLRGIIEREALAAFAEDAGLGDELEMWLLHQICATGRAWQKRLQRPFYLTLPILSRRQLASADFAARVQDELQRHGLPRAAVELEVSERLLSLELEAAGSGLEHLRSLGITLAVDRFGTGPSSLRLLRDAPLRSLRIAAELLEGVPGHDGRTRFARAFLRMARELKLRVVVDGVSRKEQLAFLRHERCDAASGLLCGDLLGLEACGRWLAEDAPKLAAQARDLMRPATLVR